MYDKLIIGIDESSDLDALIERGVRQFYFGYLLSDYEQKYASQVSLNRRYRKSEQFGNLQKAHDAIERVHDSGGIIYLALNAMHANSEIVAYSETVYELFSELVDGVIAATIPVLMMLQRRRCKNIVLSNLMGIYSVEAARFLIGRFQPLKVILPRDITPGTLEAIVTAFPDTAFECFLHGDNCRYSESFCYTEHGYDSVGFGSLCSFAMERKIPIAKPSPAFKQIVKNPQMEDAQKREVLKAESLEVSHLLDTIDMAVERFDTATAAKMLEQLERYDAAQFHSSPALLSRTRNLCKRLEYPKAQMLLQKLEAFDLPEIESYTRFHKLNAGAIARTLELFGKFSNITSYKIPARGRNALNLLSLLEADVPYDYRASQYRL